MKRRYTSAANRDLTAAIEYLMENASATAAAKLLRQIDKALDLLSMGLIHGPEVNVEGRVCWAVSVPPYKVYYVIDHNTLVVLRIYHQARAPIEVPAE